jgi:Mn-dependent DtxR family transcriptional regulator
MDSMQFTSSTIHNWIEEWEHNLEANEVQKRYLKSIQDIPFKKEHIDMKKSEEHLSEVLERSLLEVNLNFQDFSHETPFYRLANKLTHSVDSVEHASHMLVFYFFSFSMKWS